MTCPLPRCSTPPCSAQMSSSSRWVPFVITQLLVQIVIMVCFCFPDITSATNLANLHDLVVLFPRSYHMCITASSVILSTESPHVVCCQLAAFRPCSFFWFCPSFSLPLVLTVRLPIFRLISASLAWTSARSTCLLASTATSPTSRRRGGSNPSSSHIVCANHHVLLKVLLSVLSSFFSVSAVRFLLLDVSVHDIRGMLYRASIARRAFSVIVRGLRSLFVGVFISLTSVLFFNHS